MSENEEIVSAEEMWLPKTKEAPLDITLRMAWRCSECGKWSHAKRKPKRHLVRCGEDAWHASVYADCPGHFEEWTFQRLEERLVPDLPPAPETLDARYRADLRHILEGSPSTEWIDRITQLTAELMAELEAANGAELPNRLIGKCRRCGKKPVSGLAHEYQSPFLPVMCVKCIFDLNKQLAGFSSNDPDTMKKAVEGVGDGLKQFKAAIEKINAAALDSVLIPPTDMKLFGGAA